MKIDYTLAIHSENKEFIPNNEIRSNISENQVNLITAGNSNGKTFILNLLSYALFLDTNPAKSLPSKILSRISKFHNESEFTLEYSIEIKLANGRNLVLSKSSDGERKAEVDNKPYGHKNLTSIIDVVYDVPSDPVERITNVISSVDQWNDALFDKTKTSAYTMGQLVNSLKESRNEALIQDLMEQIEYGEKRITELEKERGLLQESMDSLEDLRKLRTVRQKLLDKNAALVKMKRYKSELDKCPKPEKKAKRNDQLIKKYRDANSEHLLEIQSLLKVVSDAIATLSEHTNISHFTKRLQEKPDYTSSIETEGNDWFELHHSYTKIVDEVTNDMINSCDKILDNPAAQELNSLKKIHSVILASSKLTSLKSLLSEKMNLDVEILLDQLSDIIDDAAKYNEIEVVKHKLRDIGGNLRDLGASIFQNVRFINTEKIKGTEDSSNKYQELYDKWVQAEQSFNRLSIEHTDFVLKLSKHFQVHATELKALDNNIASLQRTCKDKSIVDTKEKLNDATRKLKDQDTKVISNRTKLSIEDAKKDLDIKPKTLGIINKLQTDIMMLNNNVMNFQKPIKKYKTGQAIETNHIEDQKFIEIVGQIIASSLNNFIIRSGGEKKEISSFDISKDKFLCVDGSSILKSEVSTGISSATYLTQVINNCNKPNMLFLFDEIGDISESSMNIVVDAIKQKITTNSTCTAVMTRVDHADETLKLAYL